MTKGRRLRLDRRKAGLSQEELAAQLGCTKDELSKMENDKVELSPAAAAFSANLPARIPRGKGKAEGPAGEPQPGGGEPPSVEEEVEGLGPRVDLPDGGDKPPRPSPAHDRQLLPARGEIAQLESDLLKMFAGERLIVPKQTADGVVQTEAVIPGIAQVVAMYDEFDGMIIETYSPGMAKAWAELARENPAVRRLLIGLTYGGAYRGVLAASLPPLLAILAHHGKLNFGGPPAVVEHQPGEPPPPGPPGSEAASSADWNGGVAPGTEPLFDAEAGLGA